MREEVEKGIRGVQGGEEARGLEEVREITSLREEGGGGREI